MHISFLPLGDKDAASTRIRVFILREALCSSGIHTTIGYDASADVLVVQKRVDKTVFRLAKRAKREGKLVVYDVDDFGDALAYCCSPKYLRKVMALADLVTTDTQCRLEYIRTNFNPLHIVVLPNAVDYYAKECVRPPLVADDKLRVLWFGGIKNFGMFEKHLSSLSAMPQVKIVVVTAPSEEITKKYPHVEFIHWSLEQFTQILQGCHISCLMHDGTDIDRAKSNNKMVTSIAWGVPAVVSDTPDYLRTAKESGVEYTVFNNEKQLQQAIMNLRNNEARLAYLDTAQPRIWEKYSPDAIKSIFLEAIDAALKGKSAKHSVSSSLFRKSVKAVLAPFRMV